MTAQDAIYHISCLNRYYYKGRCCEKTNDSSTSENSIEGAISSELISYVEDSTCDESVTVLKLSDLVKLYNKHICLRCDLIEVVYIQHD